MDAARELDNGESCYALDLAEQLETELADMREMFKEYVKAEDAWRENFKWAHDIHAAHLRKKAKEVLGL
jgi:hypothetical protein